MIANMAPVTDLADSLKAARGSRGVLRGVAIDRSGDRMTATATNLENVVTITTASDGGPDGWQLVGVEGDPNEFPRFKADTIASPTGAATIIYRDLRRIVTGIVPAADTESSRYALGGVNVEVAEGGMLHAVATDGRRMHYATIQPVAITGQAVALVGASTWATFDAVIRATARKLLGHRTGLEKHLRGTDVVIAFGTDAGRGVVVMTWHDDSGTTVTIRARLIDGRFPRWRDILAADAINGPAIGFDGPSMVALMDDVQKRHRADEIATRREMVATAGRDRAKLKQARCYVAQRGVTFGPSGIVARGMAWSRSVPAAAAEVILDPRYAGEAIAAAVTFGDDAVDLRVAHDDVARSPVAIVVGGHRPGEAGPGFTAVIMPMAE